MSNYGEKVCDSCPFLASLNVSENIMETSCSREELHENDNQHRRAIASIKLARRILTDICSSIGCDGPGIVDGGYKVCSNMRSFVDTRNFIEGPTNTSLNLETLLEISSNPSRTGYL